MCMKRIAAIVLIMAVFCSLAGCGTDTVATEAETTEAGSEPETSTIETTGAEETTTEPTQTEETVTEPSETETATEAATDPEEQSIQAAVPAETEAETEAPHVCSYVAQVIEPTCIDQGYTLYTCSVCGKSYKDNWTEPLGHNMVEVSRDAPEDMYDDDKYFDDTGWYAIITYKCDRCGYTETKKELMRTWDSLDAHKVEQYIINYAVNTYGYTYDPSLNLNNGGYYPPMSTAGLDENQVGAYGCERVNTTVKSNAFYDDITVEEEIERISGGGRCNVYMEHDGPNWEIYFLYG